MNWDYIAGFFDGEGSVTDYKRKCRVTITQTNQEVLERIRRFAGVGSIAEITKRKSHWKDSWVYYISKQIDLLKFLNGVVPRLVVKRKLARNAIVVLEYKLQKREVRRQELSLRMHKARELRKQGLPYRDIGKALNIDFGHARRIVLGKRK